MDKSNGTNLIFVLILFFDKIEFLSDLIKIMSNKISTSKVHSLLILINIFNIYYIIFLLILSRKFMFRPGKTKMFRILYV